MSQKTVLYSYYGATILFLLLDLVFSFSIRATFFDANTPLRMLYYLFCMLCFLVMVWKPAWSALIGAIESVVTLSALILVMGVRVIIPTDPTIETGDGAITAREILNFILAGGVAYIAWGTNMKELFGRRP